MGFPTLVRQVRRVWEAARHLSKITSYQGSMLVTYTDGFFTPPEGMEVLGVAFGAEGTLVVKGPMDEEHTVLPSGLLAAGIIHPMEITSIGASSTAKPIAVFF